MSNPIEIIQHQMELYFEGEIMKAVMRVGINVDKEELIKLLGRNTPMCCKETTLYSCITAVRVTECPACHRSILSKNYDYPHFCTYCGQAIKHEEEQE